MADGKFWGASASSKWVLPFGLTSLGLLWLFALAVLATSASAQQPAAAERPIGLREHGSYIYHSAISADGRLAITDGEVWDVATGKRLAELPVPPLEKLPYTHFHLAFSPDSRFVAVHTYDELALVEAATSLQRWCVTLPRRNENCRQGDARVVFSPDGKELFSARNDEPFIRVWDAAAGRERRAISFAPHAGGQNGSSFRSFAAAADGQTLFVHYSQGGGHDEVVLLDPASSKELRRFDLSDRMQWIGASSVDATGGQLAFSRGNAVHVIDLATGQETQQLKTECKYVFYPAFTPDGQRLVASVRSPEGELDWLQCWDVSSGKSLALNKQHPGAIRAISMTPDGKYVMYSNQEGTTRFWQLPDVSQ